MLDQKVRHATSAGIGELGKNRCTLPDGVSGAGHGGMGGIIERRATQIVDPDASLHRQYSLGKATRAHFPREKRRGVPRRRGPHGDREGQRRLARSHVAAQDHDVPAPDSTA